MGEIMIRNRYVYIPAKEPEDWKTFLADPDKQWRDGYSAKSLAYTWQNSDGFPEKIRMVLKQSDSPVFQNITPLIALPEHKVPLPGGRAESQNDLFVLAKSIDQLTVIMVEGKVSEPFGPLVSEWFKDPSEGKKARLSYLCNILNLQQDRVYKVRYQLLHRTASAIIEARRFTASNALMLVHSFSEVQKWFADFKEFADLYGIGAQPDRIVHAGSFDGVDLFLGWVSDKLPELQSLLEKGTVTARKCRRCGHHEIGITDTNGNYAPLKPGTKIQMIDGG